MSDHPPHATRRTRDAVLRRYLAEWGRGLVRAPDAAGEEVHLLYVVGFAAPAPLGEGESAAEPLLCSLRVLDSLGASPARRRSARTNLILVEEDPVQVARLRAALETVGLSGLVRETRDFASLAPGEIALAAASFAELAPELAEYTAAPRRTLCVLDPPTPGLLPLTALRPLLQQEGTDLVISFPERDLQKQARFRGMPVADLPQYARRIVEGYSHFFGDRRYEWLALWRAAEKEAGAEGGAAAEARMLEHYRQRLAESHPGAAVRWVPLATPAAEAETLYLFLKSEDPERALLLNRVLHAARLAGEVAWGDALSGFVHTEATGVLDLFAAPEIGGPGAGGAPPSHTREVSLPALAHEIATTFAGRMVSFREVLLHLVETDLYVEEIRRALSLLKRDGRAAYDSLEPGAQLEFRG